MHLYHAENSSGIKVYKLCMIQKHMVMIQKMIFRKQNSFIRFVEIVNDIIQHTSIIYYILVLKHFRNFCFSCVDFKRALFRHLKTSKLWTFRFILILRIIYDTAFWKFLIHFFSPYEKQTSNFVIFSNQAAWLKRLNIFPNS